MARVGGKKTLAVFLLLAISTTVLGSIVLITWASLSPDSGYLFVRLRNDANETLRNPIIHFYVSGGYVEIKNNTARYLAGVKPDLIERKDESGVEVYLESFPSNCSVEFEVVDIEVTEKLAYDLKGFSVSLSYSPSFSQEEVGREIIFIFYAKSFLGSIPIASLHQHTENGNALPYMESRTNVQWYLVVLMVCFFLLALGIVSTYLKPRLRKRYPYASLSILVLSISIYVFVGSGYELNLLPRLSIFKWLFLLCPLFHGDFYHITDNLCDFVLLAILMESWLGFRKNKTTFFWWYLVPLFLPFLAPNALSFLSSGWLSFGLSISIEAMAVSLWVYLLKNWKDSIRRRIDIFLALASGISMAVFLDHLRYLIFHSSAMSQYSQRLSAYHILYGAIAIAIGLFKLRREIWTFVKTRLSSGDRSGWNLQVRSIVNRISSSRRRQAVRQVGRTTRIEEQRSKPPRTLQ